MKIAFIVPYVPNPIRTRPYNLIVHLVQLGHEVDVFTVGSNASDRQDAASLGSKCVKLYYEHQSLWQSLLNSALAVPSSKPLQSVYSWSPKLAADLRSRLNGSGRHAAYDVAHVEHLRGSAYGTLIKSKFPHLPVVWDSVDCISYLFKQAAGQSGSLFGKWMTRFELARTRGAEGYLLSRFDHVLVTSVVDKTALLDTLPKGRQAAPISIISQGVDQEYFRPNPDVERDSDTLVFSGKMSYHANISMVMYLLREIMPRLWTKRPQVRLVVVGKDPPASIRMLADGSRVQVTGTVDDIRPFLWRATAAVVPLVYGAGIQNKILEAMATGTAVVSNSKALPSLSVTPNKELLIADTPAEFAHSILGLLEDTALRNTIGQAGFEYVKRHHTWIENTRQLSEIYRGLIARANGTVF